MGSEDYESMKKLYILVKPINDQLEECEKRKVAFSKFTIGLSSVLVALVSSVSFLQINKKLLAMPILVNVFSLITGIVFLKIYSETPLKTANELFLFAKKSVSPEDEFDKAYKSYRSTLKYKLKQKLTLSSSFFYNLHILLFILSFFIFFLLLI